MDCEVRASAQQSLVGKTRLVVAAAIVSSAIQALPDAAKCKENVVLST